MSNYTKLARCRIGGGNTLISVLDLGEQALTGVFPKTPDAEITNGPAPPRVVPEFRPCSSSRIPTISERCMATTTATAPASTAAWLTI